MKVSAEVDQSLKIAATTKKTMLKSKSKITKKEQKNLIANNEPATFASSASANDLTASTKDYD